MPEDRYGKTVKLPFCWEDDMNISEKICNLKQEKDVVILAHYYVDQEVQKLADFVGDSYALAKKSRRN